jgi:hypothetical protein
MLQRGDADSGWIFRRSPAACDDKRFPVSRLPFRRFDFSAPVHIMGAFDSGVLNG